jgi:hypothetical protein
MKSAQMGKAAFDPGSPTAFPWSNPTQTTATRSAV